MSHFDFDSSLTTEQRERIARNLSYCTKHPEYASALFRSLEGFRGVIFDIGTSSAAKTPSPPVVHDAPDVKAPDTKTDKQSKAEKSAAKKAASVTDLWGVLRDGQQGSIKRVFSPSRIGGMLVKHFKNCLADNNSEVLSAVIQHVLPQTFVNCAKNPDIESLLGDSNTFSDTAVWLTRFEVSSATPNIDTFDPKNNNLAPRESVLVARFCVALIEEAVKTATDSDESNRFDTYVKYCFEKTGRSLEAMGFDSEKKFPDSQTLLSTPIPDISGFSVQDRAINDLLIDAFKTVNHRVPDVDIAVLLPTRAQGKVPEVRIFDARLREVEDLIERLVPNTEINTAFFALAFVRWLVGGKVFTDPTALTQNYYETEFVPAFFAAFQTSDVNHQIAEQIDSAANLAHNSPPSVEISEVPDEEDPEGDTEIPEAENPKKRPAESDPEVPAPPTARSRDETEVDPEEPAESDASDSKKRPADTDIGVTTSAPESKKSKSDPSDVPPPSTRPTRSTRSTRR